MVATQTTTVRADAANFFAARRSINSTRPAYTMGGVSRSTMSSILQRVATLATFSAVTAVAAVAVVTAVTGTAATAATVDFKLSAEIKGREQRIANQMAASLGLAAPSAGGNGTFTVVVNSDVEATIAATALRERGSVLWAQAKGVDVAALSTTTNAASQTEFHGRMLAITLKDAANAATLLHRTATLVA